MNIPETTPEALTLFRRRLFQTRARVLSRDYVPPAQIARRIAEDEANRKPFDRSKYQNEQE